MTKENEETQNDIDEYEKEKQRKKRLWRIS